MDAITDLYPSRPSLIASILPRKDPVVYGGAVRTDGLLPDTLETYRRDGFLCFDSFLTASELAEISEEMERLRAAAAPSDPGVLREPVSDTVRSIYDLHKRSARIDATRIVVRHVRSSAASGGSKDRLSAAYRAGNRCCEVEPSGISGGAREFTPVINGRMALRAGQPPKFQGDLMGDHPNHSPAPGAGAPCLSNTGRRPEVTAGEWERLERADRADRQGPHRGRYQARRVEVRKGVRQRGPRRGRQNPGEYLSRRYSRERFQIHQKAEH